MVGNDAVGWRYEKQLTFFAYVPGLFDDIVNQRNPVYNRPVTVGLQLSAELPSAFWAEMKMIFEASTSRNVGFGFSFEAKY